MAGGNTSGPKFLAEDISWQLLNPSVAFVIILTLFFALYTSSRIMHGGARSIEVWLLMPLAYLSCLAICIMGILFVRIGGAGRHEAFHRQIRPTAASFRDLQVTSAKVDAATSLIYGLSITFPKLAILSMYLKIFVDKWSRRGAYATGVVVVCNCVVITVGSLTMCRPFAFRWDKTIKNGTCSELGQGYVAVSIPNIVTDVFILLLPIPTLMKVKASTYKKIGLALTFLTGSLGIVTAILRLVNFVNHNREDHAAARSDVFFSTVHTMVWTVVEPAAYFLCACMPGTRPLLQAACARLGLGAANRGRQVLGSRGGSSERSVGRGREGEGGEKWGRDGRA